MNIAKLVDESVELENIANNLNSLILPSTLWGVHTDTNYEFIAILHVQLASLSKLSIDKVILVTYDELNGCINTTLLIYNEVISIPSMQYNVRNIHDLSELTFNLHRLNLCENSNDVAHPRCLKYVKGDNLQFCTNCTLQDYYEYADAEIENFDCNPNEANLDRNYITDLSLTELETKTIQVEKKTCTGEGDTLKNSSLKECKVEKDVNDNFGCDFCERTFQTKLHLKEHVRLHTGEKPYVCAVCNKSNSHRSSHHKHVQSHSSEKPNLCNVCGKTFSGGYRMEDHMLTHSAEKKYECSKCFKRFASNHNMKIHEKGHMGMRPYVCKSCGKTYTTPSNLATHVKSVHSKRKPHQCGVCRMSFLYPQLLRIHMRKHTGEKPYKCSTCGKAFAKNIHLTVHTRTHTGEKPYICSACGKAFTTTGNLTSHKRVHSKEVT